MSAYSKKAKQREKVKQRAPHLAVVNGYVRKASYPVHAIKDLFESDCGGKIDLDGDVVGLRSLRMRTFFEKSVTCVSCGAEGSYFAKEKSWSQLDPSQRYHLNLYGISKNGDHVLMTKDHIYPRSKGGPDHISNMQTMCSSCNRKKSDKII